MKYLNGFLMMVLAASLIGCAGGGGYRSRSTGSCCGQPARATYYNPCCPEVEYQTACIGNPCCPTKCCEFPLASTCCSNGLVSVSRTMPTEAPLDCDFNVCLRATANCNASDVTLTEILPCGLSYVTSKPPATKQEGNLVIWELGNMCDGQCRDVSVTYRASCEGRLTSCYSVTADPYCCQCVMVGCPCFEVTKYGPESVSIDCPVRYCIIVKNGGSAVARSVVVKDHVPPELEHSSCRKCLCWELGDMCPGECRRIDVCFRAKTCGMTCNQVTVESCNCKCMTATACTLIENCCVEVSKTGPKGPITVGQPADYRITTHNPGNLRLTNVQVVDTAPPGTRITAAPGAQISGSRAIWTVPVFEPGETKSFDLTLVSCTHGCLTNQVCVICDQDAGDCACATTQFVGIPGLWVGIKDSIDPVCVGMDTCYCINVQNQGHANDANVKIVVTFPDEMDPVAVNGTLPHTISGKTVTFDTIPVFQAGRKDAFSIRAKAVKPGDAKVKVQVMSDLLSEPYVKVESTQVY